MFEKPLPVTIIRLLGNTTAPNTDVPNTDELAPNTAALLRLPTLKESGCGTSVDSKSYLINNFKLLFVPSGSIFALTAYQLFLNPLSP